MLTEAVSHKNMAVVSVDLPLTSFLVSGSNFI